MKKDKDPQNKHLRFVSSDFGAEQLHKAYRDKDPFPEIQPALLNSADIADYVLRTGMIWPFDPKCLGPASYEMSFSGEYLYWGDDGKMVGHWDKCEESKLVLKKNSITYVSVKEKFRLPHYIAVRFNLRVKHVHRGLLLGTGPLVDPGFQGNLLIPIHNLTENEYIIPLGDDLISAEFTKISPYFTWHHNLFPQEGRFEPNTLKNSRKTFRELTEGFLPEYITKVMSSLTATLLEAKKEIEKAKAYRLVFAAATVIAIIAICFQLSSYISDAHKYVADATMIFRSKNDSGLDLRNIALKDDINKLNDKIAEFPHLVERVKTVEDIIESDTHTLFYRDEIEKLKLKIHMLEIQVHDLSMAPQNNTIKK